MIDKLIKLVHQHGGEALNNNPAIPEKSRNEAAQLAAQEIFSGMQEKAKNGDIDTLMTMFSTGGTNASANPIIYQISSNIAAKFATRFGMSPQVAQQIASTLVPAVVSHFVKKTNDPNDSELDLQDVLKNFTGNANMADLTRKPGNNDGIGGMFRR
jgi:hypothetical protein